MTPKKLTDCPENLREAIDWLIQVRHGNGKADEGLTKLSQALKRLIDEAIGKAYTTNVAALIKIFDSAKSYKCCKDNVAEIEKLKDSKNLENKNFSDLKTKSENIKKCYKSHLDASQQKAYVDIVSRLEQLLKLKESLKGLTDEEECKKLLTNLCTGLEKFLGFNSDSKGYDGSGIVYSDLDRLCDGVVAFLYGLLNAVKNDDAITTYDKDMTNKLEKVLEEVNKNIGTGRAGLVDAVAAVKAWLEGYGREVNVNTKNVENGLKWLTERINEHEKSVENNKGNKLSDQLDEWATAVSGLSSSVDSVERDHVSKLDDALKKAIMCEIKVLKKTVNTLVESAKSGDVKEYAQRIDDSLDAEENDIVKKIDEQCECVKDGLQAGFYNIGERIRALEKTKKTHIEHIKNLISGAKEEVHKLLADFEIDYKIHITNMFIELHAQMGDINKNDGESNLHAQFGIITQSVDAIEALYKRRLQQIKMAVVAAVDQALEKDEQHSLDKLDDAVKDGLKHVRDMIYTQLASFGRNVERQILATASDAKRYDWDHDATAVTSLGTQLSKLGFKGLDATLVSIAHKSKDLARPLQEVLRHLGQAKSHGDGSGEFSNLLAVLRQSMQASIQEQLRKVVPDKHSGLMLENLMTKYHKETKKDSTGGKENGIFRGLIILIKNHFTKEGFDEDESVDKFTPDLINGYKHTTVTAGGGDNQGAKSKYSAAEGEVNGIITKLENLPTLVTKLKENAKTKMETLYEKIQTIKTMVDTYLEPALTTASEELDKTIKALRAAANEIYAKSRESVSQMKKTLRHKVQSTFTMITNQVRTLFSDAHKADLAALKTLVEEQKEEIERIIFTNKMSGIKGFIAAMSSNLCEYIDPLKYPTLPESSEALKFYLDPITDYIRMQVRSPPKVPGKQPEPSEESKKVWNVNVRLDAMLDYLHHNETAHPDDPTGKRIYSFDHHSDKLLSKLEQSLTSLSPTFSFPSPLLAPLKAGLQAFAAQLGHAYVNRYSGVKMGELLKAKEDDKTPKDASKTLTTPKPKEQVLTPEGRNCAKVCLTIVEMVMNGLAHLEMKCKDASKYGWKSKTICEKIGNKENPLGTFLDKCGFRVPTNDGRKQDGELQWESDFTGKNIFERIDHTIHISKHEHVPQCRLPEKEWNFNVIDFIKCFYTHIKEYNQVGHLAALSSKRHPCSVFEMLCWLNGLTHHPVYLDLTTDGFNHLLDKPKKSGTVVPEDLPLEDFSRLSIEAYPNDITYTSIHDAITHITLYSHDLLTTVVGFGDEATQYACDYANNSMRLHYPAGPSECFEMLVSVIRRLLPVLRFVEIQCQLSSRQYGWADCEYGKNVPTTKSLCNEQPSGKPKCQPTCEANSKPTCHPTSPLMCYLSDSLIGCLPHQVESIGCKSECKTCVTGKHGMPCLTPLGFRAFSGSTKTGKDLCQAIVAFFGDANLSSLLCLTATPPATLPEHFGFALSLAHGLSAPKSRNTKAFVSLAETMETSITSRSIALYDTPSSLTTPICNAYGSTQNGLPNREVKRADLSSLSTSAASSEQTAYTAPYLYSLCYDSYYYLANKHSNSYLSWAIYLPWALHTYLEGLRDALKNIFCHDWGCITCLHGDKCKRGEHGIIDGSCKCASVVSCRGVLPTLYKYGFTFEDAKSLTSTKKTCFAFIQQIHNVIKSICFTELFEECDNFLFKIREPFIWLNVALWLLSFLYLLHIMVIRLDLLHIKSHLHSPSSHRIAAQSLLAAARVGKLSKISYLQA